MNTDLDFTELTNELRRTYHYGDGSGFTIDNVTKLCVRPSGSHRLEVQDGRKYIVRPDWHVLEIVAKEWSC